MNELRSRAGVLIAAAAITTSFFGSRAVSGDQLGTWVWVAVAAFAVVGVRVLLVLWPRSDWSFSASAADIISEYIEPEPLKLPLIHRAAAADQAELDARQNARRSQRRSEVVPSNTREPTCRRAPPPRADEAEQEAAVLS